MLGIVPHVGIKEFFDLLHNDPYDPDDIYKVWEKMKADPEARQLMQNNIDCGVCKEGYMDRPTPTEIVDVIESRVSEEIVDATDLEE